MGQRTHLLVHLHQAAAARHQLVCRAHRRTHARASSGEGQAAQVGTHGQLTTAAGNILRALVQVLCVHSTTWHTQPGLHGMPPASSPASTRRRPRTGVVRDARVHLGADTPRHRLQEHGAHVDQGLVHLRVGGSGSEGRVPASARLCAGRCGRLERSSGCRRLQLSAQRVLTQACPAAAPQPPAPGSWCGRHPRPGCTCRRTAPAQWQTAEVQGNGW